MDTYRMKYIGQTHQFCPLKSNGLFYMCLLPCSFPLLGLSCIILLMFYVNAIFKANSVNPDQAPHSWRLTWFYMISTVPFMGNTTCMG